MMNFKLAWRNLWRNKRRSLITMTSVCFAVFLSSVMMSFKSGTYDTMIRSMASISTGYIQIHGTNYWDDQTLDQSIPEDAALRTRILNTPGVADVVERLNYGVLAAGNEVTRMAMIVGTNMEAEKSLSGLDETVVEGRYLTNDDDGALVGAGLAKYLGISLGDSIVVLGQGYHAMNAAAKFEVKGIIKIGSPELSKSAIFIALPNAQRLFGMEGRVTSYIVIPQFPGDAQKISTALSQGLSEELSAKSWEEMLPELVDMIAADKVEGYVFMFILYMVISFGLFGTAVMMMAERKYEFGVLASIGMGRMRLGFVIVIEMFLVSILGAIFGVVLTFPFAYYFKNNPIVFGEEYEKIFEEYGMEPTISASVDASIFMEQALVVACIAIFIGLFPFINILKMNPLKSMRAAR